MERNGKFGRILFGDGALAEFLKAITKHGFNYYAQMHPALIYQSRPSSLSKTSFNILERTQMWNSDWERPFSRSSQLHLLGFERPLLRRPEQRARRGPGGGRQSVGTLCWRDHHKTLKTRHSSNTKVCHGINRSFRNGCTRTHPPTPKQEALLTGCILGNSKKRISAASWPMP